MAVADTFGSLSFQSRQYLKDEAEILRCSVLQHFVIMNYRVQCAGKEFVMGNYTSVRKLMYRSGSSTIGRRRTAEAEETILYRQTIFMRLHFIFLQGFSP